LIKTTDNSSGRELSAFLPYSDTHAPVQGLRDLEAKKRNAVDHVYSLLHAAAVTDKRKALLTHHTYHE
jgi:hypothetical protein